jgi:hypothetical protein
LGGARGWCRMTPGESRSVIPFLKQRSRVCCLHLQNTSATIGEKTKSARFMWVRAGCMGCAVWRDWDASRATCGCLALTGFDRAWAAGSWMHGADGVVPYCSRRSKRARFCALGRAQACVLQACCLLGLRGPANTHTHTHTHRHMHACTHARTPPAPSNARNRPRSTPPPHPVPPVRLGIQVYKHGVVLDALLLQRKPNARAVGAPAVGVAEEHQGLAARLVGVGPARRGVQSINSVRGAEPLAGGQSGSRGRRKRVVRALLAADACRRARSQLPGCPAFARPR